MTAQTRATNAARFEQGDTPQGTDFADLIDSFVSLSDTTAQSITSDLVVANLITSGEVSCGSLRTGAFTATNLAGSTVSGAVIRAATLSAARIEATGSFTATTGVFTAPVSASSAWFNGPVRVDGVLTLGAVPVLVSGSPVSAATNTTAANPVAVGAIGAGVLNCRGLIKLTVNGTSAYVPFFYGGS